MALPRFSIRSCHNPATVILVSPKQHSWKETRTRNFQLGNFEFLPLYPPYLQSHSAEFRAFSYDAFVCCLTGVGILVYPFFLELGRRDCGPGCPLKAQAV